MDSIDAQIALPLLILLVASMLKLALGGHFKLLDFKPLRGGVVVHPARHGASAFGQLAIIAAAGTSDMSRAIERAKSNVLVRALLQDWIPPQC